MKILRTASLGSNFTCSFKKVCCFQFQDIKDEVFLFWQCFCLFFSAILVKILKWLEKFVWYLSIIDYQLREWK